MIFSIIWYVYLAALVIFFIYLLFRIFRSVELGQLEARRIALVSTILWSLTIPVSAFFVLMSAFGSGSPNSKMWALIMAILGGFLLFLLCLYSLSNIWMRYRLNNSKQLLYTAIAPYIGLLIFVIAVGVNYFF